jgi:hypothetical protein
MFRKLLVAVIFSCFMVSQSFGALYIGSKAAGMGGCGVSSLTGLSGVYYNPAALMAGGVGGFNSSIGTSYSNFDKLTSAIAGLTNISQFLVDNFGNDLSFSNTFYGFAGTNMNKVGMSFLPYGMISISKGAGALQGTFNGDFAYTGYLTLGTSFAVPHLPTGLHVGTNIKYTYDTNANITATALDPTADFDYSIGSGYGLDIGALTTFSIPAVTDLSVGIAARDIIGTITYDDKSIPFTFNNATGQITQGPEVTIATGRQETLKPTYLVGASGSISAIGVQAALDLEMQESNTITHFGVEIPLQMNTIFLRAGIASGNNVALTTIGTKIALPFTSFDFAYIIDSNDSTNNQVIVDFSTAI